MEKEDHHRHSEGAKDKGARPDRRSANGTDPEPKKGGHGGWGRLDENDEVDVIDKNDPNYDEEEGKANN